VEIHGGRSIRRDCADCGAFIEFQVWYGNCQENAAGSEVLRNGGGRL
jgi:hypothetical protein